MKTILFISPTGTFDNGAEVSIFNLMKQLKKSGNQIINIAPSPRGIKSNDYSEKCKINGIETYLISSVKWWWEDAPGTLIGNIDERASSYRDSIQAIRKVIQKYNVDIVITNTVNMFQGAVAAACEQKAHYWIIHEFPENEFSYYREKIDFIDQFSDEIYTVTGELNAKLTQLFTSREIKTFAPFTEIKPTELKKGDKHRIVSVGRLTERKNQLELIKAYEALGRKDIPLVFIGAWDDAYKELCKKYIKKHNLKNIKFTGNLENPWEEITDKDICVFTSQMETFGLVYVETLLNGIPAIISDNPGHLSAYKMFDFGRTYHLGDINLLAKQINYTLNNFNIQKAEAVNFSSLASDKYQIEAVYQSIITDVEKNSSVRLNPIRHIANIVSYNEHKSKLAKLEFRVRNFLQRLKNKFF